MENQNLKCDQCQSPIADAKTAIQRNGKTYCSEACANQSTQRSGS
jgi:hypothetical protein